MPLFDIGANLTSGRFRNDLDAVLRRAREAGVTHLAITGTSLDESREALALAERHEGTFATAGVHPHDAKTFSPSVLSKLRQLAEHDNIVAIGETGLDFNRDYSPRPQQETAFSEQLQLAADCGKPLFLHQRDAHERFLPLLKEQRDDLGRVVVHCFTGNRQELFDYLDLDCYIGITGWICDQRRGGELRELVSNVPDNRLLIETDAPYLLPHNLPEEPHQKRRNEPAYLPWVLKQVAQSRGQDEDELAAITFANSQAFFGV